MRIAAVLRDPELEWMRIGLRDVGLENADVRVFQSDLEALQRIYLDGRPDLMAVDMDLPEAMGLETVRAIRQQRELAALPLILVTLRDLALGSQAAESTQCLVKPVHPEAWVKAVRVALPASPAKSGAVAAEPLSADGAPSGRGEFRKAVRRPFETPCLVVVPGKKVKGVLRDISMKGAGITLYGDLGGSSMVSLVFGIAGTVPLKTVQFKARVARRTQDGYGVSFREMDPDARVFLLSLTSR